MSHKLFAERLNRELDAIDAPLSLRERVDALAKLLHIQKFQAEAFLSGSALPMGDVLVHLGEELEVNPAWLIGKSDDKKPRE